MGSRIEELESVFNREISIPITVELSEFSIMLGVPSCFFVVFICLNRIIF